MNTGGRITASLYKVKGMMDPIPVRQKNGNRTFLEEGEKSNIYCLLDCLLLLPL